MLMFLHSVLRCVSFCVSYFFYNETEHTKIYTLSLHDALPISVRNDAAEPAEIRLQRAVRPQRESMHENVAPAQDGLTLRSEEHTSELQSRFDLVCRLLLEKKKNMK